MERASDIPCLGIDLGELHLMGSNRGSRAVIYDKSRAGGTLIQGPNEGLLRCHAALFSLPSLTHTHSQCA